MSLLSVPSYNPFEQPVLVRSAPVLTKPWLQRMDERAFYGLAEDPALVNWEFRPRRMITQSSFLFLAGS